MVGIYKIENIVTGTVYIGQTTNYWDRIRKHLFMLNEVKHENPHLQDDWNRFGRDNFKFCIELYIDISDKFSDSDIKLILLFYENEIILKYNNKYNILPPFKTIMSDTYYDHSFECLELIKNLKNSNKIVQIDEFVKVYHRRNDTAKNLGLEYFEQESQQAIELSIKSKEYIEVEQNSTTISTIIKTYKLDIKYKDVIDLLKKNNIIDKNNFLLKDDLLFKFKYLDGNFGFRILNKNVNSFLSVISKLKMSEEDLF